MALRQSRPGSFGCYSPWMLLRPQLQVPEDLLDHLVVVDDRAGDELPEEEDLLLVA
ncbi:hypothetical protein ACFLSJ_01995 [Verrucomicrobiota bacterium]